MMDKKRGGYRKKKVCQFCADKNKTIDYKDVETLKKYVTERGKILPKRVTGTCDLDDFILFGMETVAIVI